MRSSSFALLASFALSAVLGGGGLWLSERSSSGPAAAEAVVPQAVAPAAEEDVAGSPEIPSPRAVEVPILVYHTVRAWESGDGPAARAYNVTPETFEAHLALLAERGYESVGFGELEDAVLRGAPLPPRPVLITLDDGTASHYAQAFPALVRHGFTATFFVFTNAIDRPNYLTSDQILEMREAGMRFGNHTRYHQYLTRLPPEEAVAEMRVGKERLEALLGEEIAVIAWPFGLHDGSIETAAALLGHRMGRTISEGKVHGPDGLMTLRAYQMTEGLRRLEYALGEASVLQ